MFYGRNESGKEFDLVDDDNEVFASSDSLDDIRATERTAPAICGVLRLRRCLRIVRARQAEEDKIRESVRLL